MRRFAVIFDMDGLMIDSERLYIETETEMARKRGAVLTRETIARMMGRKPIESMRIYKEDLGLVDAPADLLHERDVLMMERMEKDLTAMPGLFECLESFYERYALAIATGAESKFLALAVDTLGIRNRFDVLVPSDEILEGKPSPEIYLRAMHELKIQPDHCAVLEDSANGCLSARRAGAYVVAVPSEHTAHQDFTPAHFMADDLLHARDHILGVFGG